MEDNSSLSNQRIAKNTLFLYLRLVVVMLLNLLTTRFVLSALGVEDYGVYNVVCGFVAMFGFLNTSFTNGIQRFYNYELARNGEEGVIRVYNIGFLIQSSLSIIVILLLLTLGLWYLNNKLVISDSRILAANWVFIFSALSLIFIIMQALYSAAVIAYEKMGYYAVISIIEAVAKLSIAIGIRYANTDRLVIYGLLMLIMQVLIFLLYTGYCKYNFRHLKLRRKFDGSLFKYMVSFSGWNILGSFAFMLRGQGVNILLNTFFGAVINAANAIASQISSAVQAFSLNIMIAFQPQLTQSYAKENHERTEELMLNMTKISYVLYCIISIPIIVEVKYLLTLWLGNVIPDYTEPFVILTVVIMGLGLFHTSITQTFLATGKLKSFQITTSLIICAILPISWLLLKNGTSPISVYIVTLVVYFVNWVVCLLILHRIFKFSVKRYMRMVGECILLTGIAVVISQSLHIAISASIIRIIGIFCMTSVVMIGGLWLTLSKSHKEQILETLKQRLSKRKIVTKIH